MDTGIKTDCIYKDVAEDVETRHATWNYELQRSLPKRKKEKMQLDQWKMN